MNPSGASPDFCFDARVFIKVQPSAKSRLLLSYRKGLLPVPSCSLDRPGGPPDRPGGFLGPPWGVPDRFGGFQTALGGSKTVLVQKYLEGYRTSSKGFEDVLGGTSASQGPEQRHGCPDCAIRYKFDSRIVRIAVKDDGIFVVALNMPVLCVGIHKMVDAAYHVLAPNPMMITTSCDTLVQTNHHLLLTRTKYPLRISC